MKEALTTLVIILILASPAGAAAPLRDYAERLAKAEGLIDPLVDGEPAAGEVLDAALAVKKSLSQYEEVEFNGQNLRVDNSWLHETLDAVIENVNGDSEQLRSMLIEIADRLQVLQSRIRTETGDPNAELKNQSSKLDSILARSEYRRDQRQESLIKKWLRQILDKVVQFLSRFESKPREDNGKTGSKTITGLRILIALFLLAALASGITYIFRRLLSRRNKVDADEMREILGEEISIDLSPSDLLKNARELAVSGDFRSAIRRAYIALLCEMELKGKIKLERSRTNRDYLEEMSKDKALLGDFARMTWSFEQTWYGEKRATGEDFDKFLALYRRTAGLNT